MMEKLKCASMSPPVWSMISAVSAMNPAAMPSRAKRVSG